MQSRLVSGAEAATNTFIGYWVSVAAGYYVYPWFHVDISLTTNMGLTFVFVCLSFLRSFVVRRWFEAGIRRTLVKVLAWAR